nr:nitric oxide-associated protein 1-like [Oncorhynchus nerka]
MANTGKFTMFNTLLESDYCKSRASDVIHKATISPWPGGPRVPPSRRRVISPQELKRLEQFSKQGYRVGSIGRTFRTVVESKRGLIQSDKD